MRLGPDGDPGEARDHFLHVESTVETIFEFGQIARGVGLPHGSERAGDGALQIAGDGC